MTTRVRSLMVLMVLTPALLIGALAQPAGATATRRPASLGPATITIPLKAAWKVKSASQLTVSDGPMSCRITGLVRTGGGAATGVRVRCTGPSGSATSFPLTVSVKHKRGASASVTVSFGAGGAAPRITTVDQLLQVAPLSIPVAGTTATVGSVSFLVPANWQRTDLQDGTQLSVGDPNAGNACTVLVLSPVTPNMASVAALDQQLFDITQAVFPNVPLASEFGSTDVFSQRRQGSTGFGFPFVQLSLATQNGAARLFPYIVVFKPDLAVPVVPIGFGCDDGGTYQYDQALIFDTLSVAGVPGDPAAYRQQIVGSWGSNDGGVGVGDIMAANGHYANASALSGTVQSGGLLYDVTQSWAGDGTYGLIGPFLARFPTSSPGRGSTTLIRMYQDFVGDHPPVWRKCELGGSSTGGAPYELCMGKSA
jgi:hypothetical protein